MSAKTLETGWYWFLLPINASLGAMTTLTPLYILSLQGTVVDVAVAASAFNLALIPGALIWGRLIDLFQRRKVFILLSCLSHGLIELGIYLSGGLPETILLYALFGFMNSAIVPSVNMLLMETAPKRLWASAFAQSSAITTVGLMFGVVPGAFWTAYFPLKSYFLLASSFSIPSLLLAALLVREPEITFERQVIVHARVSFLHRFANLPLLFLRLPHPAHVKQFYRIARTGLSHELPLLYLASFLFSVSASLFHTSYIPFLKNHGVGESLIFLTSLLIFLVNAIAFAVATEVKGSRGEAWVAWLGYSGRVLSIVFAIVGAIFLSGTELFVENLGYVFLWSLGYAFITIALNSAIFKTLGEGHRGELLGIYSALTGIAVFLGALLSGLISITYSFSVTFLGALALLIASAVIFRVYRKLPIREKF